MIETVDPADCGSYTLHAEHNWREGFLWLAKKHCYGSVRIHAPRMSDAKIREMFGLPDSWTSDGV